MELAMTQLFPVFINLTDKPCLVLGGGQVAARKVQNLLDCGAVVIVISPEAVDDIKQYSEQGLVKWLPRELEVNDLQGIFMVFVATSSPEANQQAVDWCRERNILVNAVDDPPNCDFYVPSVLRRNSLVLAVSTEGKSPLYARKLRKELESIITPEHGEYVDLLGEQRELIKETVSDINVRKRIFEALVNSDILDLLRRGERVKVRERVQECISSWQD
ncbi:precorrin-2 dehydrogenase/sirohydrochlorin ferrochelatase family protein [Syntrophomonas palmitatica]|uniref:precorrin-2 dehydrogenase/sirohydrochlorin ferrochelatase family protein n=1 Tax=Syntrophomonas palmitatica TaxID=402877 RepID=UPI0012EE83C7|nr:bifunctional precorrin-2 dehydrogenase/sirohydrochlorin ferrochelatase [Syntrophomonas palmitatica]